MDYWKIFKLVIVNKNANYIENLIYEKDVNLALVSELYQFENNTKSSNYNSIAVVKH